MAFLVEGKFCFRAHEPLINTKKFPPGLYVEGKAQDILLTKHKDLSQLLTYVFFVWYLPIGRLEKNEWTKSGGRFKKWNAKPKWAFRLFENALQIAKETAV